MIDWENRISDYFEIKDLKDQLDDAKYEILNLRERINELDKTQFYTTLCIVCLTVFFFGVVVLK